MRNELAKKQGEIETDLEQSLDHAVAIITKNYLDKLESYEIIKPSYEDIDTNISHCGKFYKLSKLVVNKEENFLDKLTTIVNVVSSIDCSIATIIDSDGNKIDYYLGIVSKNARVDNERDKRRREANAAAFRGALTGNLIGSEWKELPSGEVEQFRKTTLAKEGSCYASVSGIVALRDEDAKDAKGYVQGIENLVDSLKGQKYTIVMLADPIDTTEIQVIRQGYEMLYTQLSAFAGSSVTMSESDTSSLSKARSEGFSKGISSGISMSQSRSRSKGSNFGVNAEMGIDFIVKGTVGVSAGFHRGTSETTGKTDTFSRTRQQNSSVTDTASTSLTSGKSLQLNYQNRSVKSLLDKIDKHLERLDECESFGAFDCAAYVIAGDRETALTGASNYNALMRGKNSSVQASHINSWYQAEETKILGKYIGSLVHPRFKQSETITVTPASIVSGDELAIQIGLPKKSIVGVTVIPMAPFGRNIVNSSRESLVLGSLYHMGHEEGGVGGEQKVPIDVESLSMHTFITGSTGAGKSTAIYSLLDQLMVRKVKGRTEKIKFMVIEPAKGEYKERFGGYADVNVYGTNNKKTPLLRINPFSFPADVHILEHIDRLIEIFNVCWPMYAAMPAVLKDAVERAYTVAGWNLETSECMYQAGDMQPLYPSFADVLRQINVVLEESAYSTDSKGDYKGALCTRLKSLTNGLYGQIFTNDELSQEELFDANVIVDLSRTGSMETKALIMGLLVMKLQEYRMANARGGNEPLRHVTVLEEAHNILKRTSMEQSNEGANLLGKSVEMLSNSIAEMRTYGEGFIIADQAPGLMDLSVIRNTNTKIILRLPDQQDRELVGKAASLSDDQILELSRLRTFVAAVYQNDWLEPALCKIDTNFKDVPAFRYEPKEAGVVDKKKVVDFLLMPIYKKDQLDRKYIADVICEVHRLQMPVEAKVSFLKYLDALEKEDAQRLREEVIYQIFNPQKAFALAKDKQGNVEAWYRGIKEMLDPDITLFTERQQRQIIMALTREKAQADRSEESADLFERLMDFM